MERAQRFCLYKMTVDNGGAPCVRAGLLTLAICKPAIRRTAKEGDTIIGFAANRLYAHNSVIYIARVTKKLDGRIYYSQLQFSNRPDCIYRWDGRSFSYKRDAKYHSKEDLTHDLGRPFKYPNAQVLLSRRFRYFGKGGCRKFDDKYPHIASKIRSLAQGHRVINLPDDLWGELQKFASALWKRKSAYSHTLVPTVRSTICLRNDGGAIECHRQCHWLKGAVVLQRGRSR
jgi:hypothetical protein